MKRKKDENIGGSIVNKIGILYICTGQYKKFWEQFYTSFEKYFLKGMEINYFIFTDDVEYFEDYKSSLKINIEYLQPMPWPLITLFRFHTFLTVKEKLKNMDYLYFFNSNVECCTEIFAEDIIPRVEYSEELVVCRHPGYDEKLLRFSPYERNIKSTAYVPYNKGLKYVIGAANGGKTHAFLKMCETLKNAINEDLKKNYIAKWHDESHLNRYIINLDGVRYIGPEYCYPTGMSVKYEKKIAGIDKQKVFDVNSFKGVQKEKQIVRLCNAIANYSKMFIMYYADYLLQKDVSEYKC